MSEDIRVCHGCDNPCGWCSPGQRDIYIHAESADRCVQAPADAKPVAWVARAFCDSEHTVEGEFSWQDLDERPFAVSDPSVWACVPLYLTPTAPVDPRQDAPAASTEDDFDAYCKKVSVSHLCTLVDELRAEISALRRDAERWHTVRRLARRPRGWAPGNAVRAFAAFRIFCDDADFDAAIDTALSTPPESK